MTERIILDAGTKRRIDENGYLHVEGNRITKAGVNPYYGREIPGWEEAGLEAGRVYYGFRPPEELQRGAETFAGVPLQRRHHPDSAREPQREHRVGAVGTDAAWRAPYVEASLCVWDAAAIDGIRSGRMRELSCAYRYEPEFRSGEYEGWRYDFIMRNIRGNHVALVEEGRAGPDVVVADNRTVREDTAMTETTAERDRKTPAVGAEAAIPEASVIVATAPAMGENAAGSPGTGNPGAGTGAGNPGTPDAPAGTGTPGTPAGTAGTPDADAPDPDAPDAPDAPDDAGADGRALGEALKATLTPKQLKGLLATLTGGIGAMDAALNARREMRALMEAARRVRPLCGDVDPFAFDAAGDIYRHAAESRGLDASRYGAEACEAAVEAMLLGVTATPSGDEGEEPEFLSHLSRLVR